MPQAMRRLNSHWSSAARAASAWLCCLAVLSAVPALAQDLSNPFGEPETSRPRPKKPLLPAEPQAPLLAPMNSERVAPATTGGGADNAAAYGEPYNSGNTGKSDVPGWKSGPSNAARTQEPSTYLPDDGTAGVAMQAIERVDLAPVAAPDGAGLPNEMWGGLSAADVEALLAKLDIPPRSAALHALWRRLITSDIAPPSGGSVGGQLASAPRFTAMRAEVLYRSGLTKEALDVLSREPATATDAMLATLQARLDIGKGHRDQACANASRLTTLPPDMPAPLKAEAILIGGYCAAVAGDMSAAGLKAGLAREVTPDQTIGADALETLAAGATPVMPPVMPKGAKLSLLDYRLFELGKADLPPDAFANASPALLGALAMDEATPAAIRLSAGEAAASVNAISPDDLASIYRAQVMPADPQPADRRAELFRAADTERTPAKKTRLIRSVLDEARRAGLYWPALIMMDKSLETLQPVAEIGWFAETAIEISLASGRYDQARKWAELSSGFDGPQGQGGFAHWLALVDLADPSLTSGRAAHLDSVEALAGNGRIDANTLHRIVTVLDALEIQVPIPLWDKASRTPQPNSGYLPETGVLSQLQDASKKKEFGRTVLLAMRALGPAGADSANLIALGDSIRALRRAGLEPDARRLGLEALFAAWPRAITN